MRLKDGYQVCPSCGGSGCYWCRKTGGRARCPRCGNEEPELLSRLADGSLSCSICGTVFENDGHVVREPPIEKPERFRKQQKA
jgi:uncharacterized Zn finger protein (UPF0148 family)